MTRIVHKTGTGNRTGAGGTAPSTPLQMTPIGGNNYEISDAEIVISYAGRQGRQLDRRRLTQEQRDRLHDAGFHWDEKWKHWRKETNKRFYTLVPWDYHDSH